MRRRTFLMSVPTVAALARPGLHQTVESSSLTHDEPALWPTPVILPLPLSTLGVGNPVISLAGTWKIQMRPDLPGGTRNEHEIIVPGQADRQGFAILRGRPYTYRRMFDVPTDFQSAKVFIRFESVSGTARVWVNDHEIAGHQGGFTIWNREITDAIRFGQSNSLVVEVTDPDPKEWTSGFDHGGILRDVKVLAVPADYFSRLHVETDFDEEYKDASLNVIASLVLTKAETGRIRLRLLGPNASEVAIKPNEIAVRRDQNLVEITIPVRSPLKWDAEHPNLYTLVAELMSGDTVHGSTQRVFGFRKIEVRDRRVLVNGVEVKLRGGGRFDSDPVLGHTLSPAQCEEEVRLFKEANVNYVRPACWPALESYLDACDRLGMYVESETNVTFTRGAESDPRFTSLFMNQLAEMIEANRSHPCVLHWSLGNESSYGINIVKMFEYTKSEDKTRPILFSWSHEIPAGSPLPYNFYSYHYPNHNADLGAPGVAVFNGRSVREIPANMPVLHDEFAHGACFCRQDLDRDPNTRNFWGESIKIFWERMYPAEGCLGGAIWALVDDAETTTQVYPWGVIDLWRRPKPEYWLMKKAYSPIRVRDEAVDNPGNGKILRLPVTNWFNHANLREISITWRVGSDSGVVQGPDVFPGSNGEIEIPARHWENGTSVHLVCRHGELIVDEFDIPIGLARAVSPAAETGEIPKLIDGADHVTVAGSKFEIVFDKNSGQIKNVAFDSVEVMRSGPHLHVTGVELAPWAGRIALAKTQDDHAAISIIGTHGELQLEFLIRIYGSGLIEVQYILDNDPLRAPETRVVPWNRTDAGGFSEVGVSFVLSPAVDTLVWKRKGLWSVYPDTHIGRTSGVAKRHGPARDAPADVRPTWSWAEDESDYLSRGSGAEGYGSTNDFRSMKEYIYFASAIASGTGMGLRAESNARHAVRLEVQREARETPIKMIVNNAWNYTHLGLGNYMKEPITLDSGYTNSVSVRLTHEPA